MSAPGPTPRARLRLAIGLAILAAVGTGVTLWHARRAARPRVVVLASPTPASEPAAGDGSLPSRSRFAGSSACGDCHEKKRARWSGSWHARALAKARPDAVVGRFAGVHFKGDSSEAWMSRSRERSFMRTRDREGRLQDYAVDWVIGGKRMQDPLTVLPDGRWQVLPVY